MLVSAAKKCKKIIWQINDCMCMQAACNQSVSASMYICQITCKIKSRFAVFFSFLLCFSPTIGDKYVYYSEYISDTIHVYSVL